MYIIRDVIKNTQTGESQLWYEAKGRVSKAPYGLEGYQREADAKKYICKDMEGYKILNDNEAIERDIWAHKYTIVKLGEETELYNEMEQAKRTLKDKVFNLMTEQVLTEDEEDKKEIKLKIDTLIAKFCIVPKWFEIAPFSGQIFEELRRDWEGAKKDQIKEHIEGLIDYVSIEVMPKRRLNPIEERELREIYSKMGYGLTKVHEDGMFSFVKFM